MNNQELQIALNELQSDQVGWSEKVQIAEGILLRCGAPGASELIRLLESPDYSIRNASALALREYGSDSVVGPLLCAINNPANESNRATLVYALETHDCSEYSEHIIRLAVDRKADVRWSAWNILSKQQLLVSRNLLDKAVQDLGHIDLPSKYKGAIIARLKELCSS